jgi:hypothetical protein
MINENVEADVIRTRCDGFCVTYEPKDAPLTPKLYPNVPKFTPLARREPSLSMDERPNAWRGGSDSRNKN